MDLVHFSQEALALSDLVPRRQSHLEHRGDKPQGLWVSDEDDEGWYDWCSENMLESRGASLAVAHRVTLKQNARVLCLATCEDVQQFTGTYRGPDPSYALLSIRNFHIDWEQIAERYQGILITPYQWACRNDLNTFWYYSWDCASGCIWDPEAIESLEVIEWSGKQMAA
jgi:hypothetical protein